MYYFGNSIAIKDIAFLIFYALRFKCELIHAYVYMYFFRKILVLTYLFIDRGTVSSVRYTHIKK